MKNRALNSSKLITRVLASPNLPMINFMKHKTAVVPMPLAVKSKPI